MSKLVLASIPLYSMQTTLLPIAIFSEVDILIRNFLWGSNSENRKTHLVAWDRIYSEEKNGGLGIRKMKLNNEAFLMKLAFNMVKNRDSLWARVIKGKYNHGNNIIPTMNKKWEVSNVWRGIYRVSWYRRNLAIFKNEQK